MTALAIVGFVVLLLGAGVLFIAGLQIGFFSTMLGKFEPLALIPIIFGGLLVWLACHLFPWTISVTVA